MDNGPHLGDRKTKAVCSICKLYGFCADKTLLPQCPYYSPYPKPQVDLTLDEWMKE
jgi:hypothetical protein